jgi:hypothetical protein
MKSSADVADGVETRPRNFVRATWRLTFTSKEREKRYGSKEKFEPPQVR